jgi:hypothetical protein
MHDKNEKGSIGYDFRLNEKILKGGMNILPCFFIYKTENRFNLIKFNGKKEW